ncbi:type IV pilin protein, partial [Metallibacterium scheffleri]|uniref:type IV pilin protein n=1 Tax=Metallibacterium scheffleri TaxID=993689 RepID=UPI0023F426F2
MTRTHTRTLARPAGRDAGFTLIELMITLVVLAILTMIAVPIYEHQIEESRRTDARTALLELAEREERYYATNNAYTSDPADLGYGTAAA